MQELENRIYEDAIVIDEETIKFDFFMNQQIDIPLLRSMAKEWKHKFEGKQIDKILTVEASGIALSTVAAIEFDVPLVYAKKSQYGDFDDNAISAPVDYDFDSYDLYILDELLDPGEHVLILDDVIGRGRTMEGMLELCKKAEVIVEGIGVAIEKGFLQGGDHLREKNYPLESLAIIEVMDPNFIIFRH